MKLKFIHIFCICFSIVANAGETNQNAGVLSPAEKAERSIRMKKLFYEKNGGWMHRPGTGLGLILIHNEQSSTSVSALKDDLDYLRKFTKLPIRAEDAEPMNAKPTLAQVRSLNANMVIFIREDAGIGTSLLTAPDDCWAVINMAALKKDAPNKELLNMRFRKMVTRAFAFLCGGINSQYELTPVSHCRGLQDLDKIDMTEMPGDMMPRFAKYMLGYGVTQYEFATYKNACKQGWAHQPTNEVERAIWNEIRATPSKPMKIEFDPAAQKGKVTK